MRLSGGHDPIHGDGGDGATVLQPLDAGQQRRRRGIDLGTGRLDKRQLQPGARVRTRAHALHRRPEQLQQAHHHSAIHALGLSAQTRVGLLGEQQLGGQLAEGLHDQQLARMHLQVRGERGGVAAMLNTLLQREQRPA